MYITKHNQAPFLREKFKTNFSYFNESLKNKINIKLYEKPPTKLEEYFGSLKQLEEIYPQRPDGTSMMWENPRAYQIPNSNQGTFWSAYEDPEDENSNTLLSTYQNHEAAFRAVLDELKAGKVRLSNVNLRKVAEKEIDKFIQGDSDTLFALPLNDTNRTEFIRAMDPAYPMLMPLLTAFRVAIAKIAGLNTGPWAESLIHASKFYTSDPAKVEELAQEMRYGRYIRLHKLYFETISTVSNYLGVCSPDELDCLAHFATHHEKVSLLIFEPYLVGMIGTTAFFQFYGSWHTKKAFTTFLLDAIELQRNSVIRQNVALRSTTTSMWRTLTLAEYSLVTRIIVGGTVTAGAIAIANRHKIEAAGREFISESLREAGRIAAEGAIERVSPRWPSLPWR